MPCEAEVSDVDIVGMKFEVVSTFPEQTQYVGLKFRWQLVHPRLLKQVEILLIDHVTAVIFCERNKGGSLIFVHMKNFFINLVNLPH